MKGKEIFNRQEADLIFELIEKKLLASPTEQKAIRNKIRAIGFYASDFGIGRGYGQDDFLSVAIIGNAPPVIKPAELVNLSAVKNKPSGRLGSDENYVIDICDELLGQASRRQHCFSFLSGDSGKALPVDAYYPALRLVIEYHERQHTSSVSFWDKKKTVSGVSRAEQRRIYDERRISILPQNNIRLLIIDYQELTHNASAKKLQRSVDLDRSIIQAKLKTIEL